MTAAAAVRRRRRVALSLLFWTTRTINFDCARLLLIVLWIRTSAPSVYTTDARTTIYSNTVRRASRINARSCPNRRVPPRGEQSSRRAKTDPNAKTVRRASSHASRVLLSLESHSPRPRSDSESRESRESRGQTRARLVVFG